MHRDQHHREGFETMTRVELLQAKHTIEGRIRAAKAELVAAQRAHSQQDVDRIRNRISRLKSAASAAAVELASRNVERERSERFVQIARARLPADLYQQIAAEAA